MLAYILGITNRGKRGYKERQLNYKSGERDLKSGQRLQIGA